MENCVFCAIVRNEIPSWIIYQDDRVICFLPKIPEVYGHTIVAPKQHIVDIYAAPEPVLENLIVVAKKLALHYKDRIGATGINLLHASGAAAQQSVFHFHLHIFPRFANDGINAWPELRGSTFDKDELLEKLRL